MPVITVNDQHYALRPGQNRLGGGKGVDVQVSEDESLGVQAIVDYRESAHPVIRRAMPTAAVRVNGVELLDPTPLMHGDKVEIGGNELLFSDDTKAGATRVIARREMPTPISSRPAPAAPIRVRTAPAGPLGGGRLLSLVDGKEYIIEDQGLTIGRDAASDIVVPQQDVSRKHAVIVRTEHGSYELRDFSSNGVFLNQKRVRDRAVLTPSDLIRIGSEEFRFRADEVQASQGKSAAAVASRASAAKPSQPPRSPQPAPATKPSPVSRASPAAPPPAPAARPIEAPKPAPAAPAAKAKAVPLTPAPEAPVMPVALVPVAPVDRRPVLATLEITNIGPTNGETYELRTALSHIGRGAHNDVAILDESLSDTHAKLQRRPDAWYLTDLESTNGSYVGGVRFTGEMKVTGVTELRFGGVKMTFRPADSVWASPPTGTRAIAAVNRPQLKPTTSVPTIVLIPATKGDVAPEKTLNPRAWIPVAVVLGVTIVTVGIFLLLIR